MPFEGINHRLEPEFLVAIISFLSDILTGFRNIYDQENVLQPVSVSFSEKQMLLTLSVAPTKDLGIFTSASATFSQ